MHWKLGDSLLTAVGRRSQEESTTWGVPTVRRLQLEQLTKHLEMTEMGLNKVTRKANRHRVFGRPHVNFRVVKNPLFLLGELLYL